MSDAKYLIYKKYGHTRADVIKAHGVKRKECVFGTRSMRGLYRKDLITLCLENVGILKLQ